MLNKPLTRPYFSGGTLKGVGWPAIKIVFDKQPIKLLQDWTSHQQSQQSVQASSHVWHDEKRPSLAFHGGILQTNTQDHWEYECYYSRIYTPIMTVKHGQITIIPKLELRAFCGGFTFHATIRGDLGWGRYISPRDKIKHSRTQQSVFPITCRIDSLKRITSTTKLWHARFFQTQYSGVSEN